MRSGFHDLVAYREAVSVANDLHAAIASWPNFDRWSLGMQLMRSADSVGANIAESAGRWHALDKRRLLLIARGSLYETEHWIATAEARGLLTDEWQQRLNQVARALSGLVKKWTPN
jgi:four helix bundle protein